LHTYIDVYSTNNTRQERNKLVSDKQQETDGACCIFFVVGIELD